MVDGSNCTHFYSAEALQTIVAGADDLTMLGIDEGELALVTAIYEDLVFPRAIGEVIEGIMTPEEAAQQMQVQVEDLQAALAK